MKDGRDGLGRFATGNGGGPGRPKRATEAEYLRALSRIVSVEDLRAIARRAVADAKRGSARAREWVSNYLLGEPAPRVPPSTGRRRRVSEALFQALHELRSKEKTAVGPAGDAPRPEGPESGGADAPAPNGHTAPLPGEGQR
jgi:hypothetical protein